MMARKGKLDYAGPRDLLAQPDLKDKRGFKARKDYAVQQACKDRRETPERSEVQDLKAESVYKEPRGFKGYKVRPGWRDLTVKQEFKVLPDPQEFKVPPEYRVKLAFLYLGIRD
jgi:hypothetical protein